MATVCPSPILGQQEYLSLYGEDRGPTPGGNGLSNYSLDSVTDSAFKDITA